MRTTAAAVAALLLGSMARPLAGAPDPAAAPRVALVLSGGAALGIAHVGVIRELERAGIPIDMVLGTSMGALVGGLYASGYSPDGMQEIVEGLDWSSLFSERRDTPGGRNLYLKHRRFPLRLGFDGRGIMFDKGLIGGQNILALLSSLTAHMLPLRDFDGFPVPYRAVAADIITGEKVVFSSGSIAEAMRASMSIPGVFAPYESEGRQLVDGGISDNLPVETARSMGADIVIAVECRTGAMSDASQLVSSVAVLNQALALSIESNMRASRDSADLFIRPDLSCFGRADFSKAKALIERGEEGARAEGAGIRALAERIAASRPLVGPDEQANRRAMRDPPALSRLEISAASAEDEGIARKAFSRLVGRACERSEIEEAIRRTYSSGSFSSVSLELRDEPLEEGDDGPSEAVARVVLRREASAKNEALLGINYRGQLSPFASSRLMLAPGLYMEGILGGRSAFFAELGVGNATRAYAELFLPLGPFFAMPFAEYRAQSDTYMAEVGLGLLLETWSAAGGLLLGVDLGRKADLRAGWVFRANHGAEVEPGDEDLSPFVGVSSVSLELELRADTMSAPVFPERGVSFEARASWSDPDLGGEGSYATTECAFGAAIPLCRSLTMGLALKGGIDYSLFLEGLDALPILSAFDLRSGDMFYGLEPNPLMETGGGVLGGSLELRARLGRLHPLVDSDLFGLLNLSAGLTNPTIDESPDDWYPSLDVGLGLGSRIMGVFGVRLTADLLLDLNPISPIRPALCLQIGSMADPAGARR